MEWVACEEKERRCAAADRWRDLIERERWYRQTCLERRSDRYSASLGTPAVFR